MTKEEKIQEAYGEHWELVKNYVDENGWVKDDKKGLRYSLVYEVFKDEIDIEITSFSPKVRLKLLRGIETNNGWIKIESEDDLPKEKEFFRFIPCNKFYEEFTGWIDKELGEVLFIDFKYYDCKKDGKKFITESNAWLTCQITHYQPIQKPQPPIY